MGDSYIVAGAKVKCSFGEQSVSLQLPLDHKIFINEKAQANITDFKPMLNIPPFGMCSSMANPTVAAATAANYGRLQKMPCIPVLTMPWIGGKADLLLGDQPALLKSACLNCQWAGQIKFEDDGQ